MRPFRCLTSLLPLLPLAAAAQQAPPATDFPAGAVALSGDALAQRIARKVFVVKPSAGPSWRIDNWANGYAFIDVGSGARDSGKWRVDDTRLCYEWQKFPSGCSEVRLHGETLLLKRVSNGEVVALVGG